MSEQSAIDKNRKQCEFVDEHGICGAEAFFHWDLTQEPYQIWNGYYCCEHGEYVSACIQSHRRLLEELSRPLAIIDLGELSDMPKGVDTSR